MIRVEINCTEIIEIPYLDELSYNMWLCGKLKEAGIPIIGGLLLPKVDFSKGTLDTWDDHEKGKKIFIWKPAQDCA